MSFRTLAVYGPLVAVPVVWLFGRWARWHERRKEWLPPFRVADTDLEADVAAMMAAGTARFVRLDPDGVSVFQLTRRGLARVLRRHRVIDLRHPPGRR